MVNDSRHARAASTYRLTCARLDPARCTLKLMTCEQRRQIHSAISEVRAAQEPMQRVAGPALTPTMCSELAAKLGLEVTKITEASYMEADKQRREVNLPPSIHALCAKHQLTKRFKQMLSTRRCLSCLR